MLKKWIKKNIEDICKKPQYGFTASATEKKVGPKFLRITDITSSGVDWNKMPFCDCPPEKLSQYNLHHNDILFARIGATTGKSFIVKNPPQSVFASYLIRLRAKETVNPDFLYYYFQTPFYWTQINANKDNNLKGGVNGSVLSKLEVACPPIPEQKKIAAVLFKIQKAIGVQESIIKTTQELKKSTMQHVFTYGLHGEKTKKTEIGKMPASWNISVLEGLCELKKETCDPAKCKSGIYVGLEHIDSGNFFLKRYGSPSEVKSSKHQFKPKDILYGKLRPYLDKVVMASDYGICSTDILVFNLLDNTPPLFIVGLLHSQKFIDFAIQTTGGVNHPRTSWTSLKHFKMPLPRLYEQIEISKTFQTIEEKIELHTAKKNTFQELFKTMLNKLMTGKIRVKDLDINVSEVSG